MIQQSIQPSAHLKKYIREYVIIHLDVDRNLEVPVKPYPTNPEQGITFYINGFVTATDPVTRISEKRPSIVIFGQPVFMQILQPTRQYMMFDIRFQPGYLYKFIRTPMTEFLHKNVDAELILGWEVRHVNDDLANARNYESMVALVESYLWKKICNIKEDNHPFEKIAPMLQDNPQSFCLDEIARKACLSPSQFERKFQLQTGVTPKFFSRVSRFFQAFELKVRTPTLDWMSVAVRSGYADYQHLVKDFKQFSGYVPNILMEDYNNSVERWLDTGLIPNFV